MKVKSFGIQKPKIHFDPLFIYKNFLRKARDETINGESTNFRMNLRRSINNEFKFE